MDAIIILTYLVVKHFIADFVYQPPYQWMNKGTYGHPGGIVHALQHSIATTGLLFIFPFDIPFFFAIVFTEGVIHYHIDWAKMNINSKMGWNANQHNEFWILLGLDQLLHYLTYIGITLLLIA